MTGKDLLIGLGYVDEALLDEALLGEVRLGEALLGEARPEEARQNQSCRAEMCIRDSGCGKMKSGACCRPCETKAAAAAGSGGEAGEK